MKKVGIVTLNGYINHGNRLQNYALKTVMESLDFDVYTIRFARLQRRKKFRLFLAKIKMWVISPRRQWLERKRVKLFYRFSEQFLAETDKEFFLDDDLSALNRQFDFLVVGSDQVWNPSMNLNSSVFFLTFADSQKRIAYAPSFGIGDLPNEVKTAYKKWISEIPYVSTREKEGASIISELMGRNVPVLVDPTMLLSKEEWGKISILPKYKPQGKYIVTYFLGDFDDENRTKILRLAEKNKCEIVHLGKPCINGAYISGPSEFISYIKDCECCITDSFHGTVFSIIFEKNFWVFERQGSQSMYSRIETLLSKLNLEERKATTLDNLDLLNHLDFSCVQKAVIQEREIALNYLKEALHVEE